jgi:hypothetical protein
VNNNTFYHLFITIYVIKLQKKPMLFNLVINGYILVLVDIYKNPYNFLQSQYSQHFIFLVANKSAQWARFLHYTRLERLARDKHSSIVGWLVCYEENEVFWIRVHYIKNDPKSILRHFVITRILIFRQVALRLGRGLNEIKHFMAIIYECL